MKKTDLVRKIAKRSGETIKTTQAVFDATFEELRELLLAGDSFAVERFAGFKTVINAPREARNPLTGEKVSVPAMRRLRVTPSLAFKKELKETSID